MLQAFPSIKSFVPASAHLAEETPFCLNPARVKPVTPALYRYKRFFLRKWNFVDNEISRPYPDIFQQLRRRFFKVLESSRRMEYVAIGNCCRVIDE